MNYEKIENFFQDKNYKFEILDKFNIFLNIDRIKFFNNSNYNNINAISAAYHLDNKNKLKKGGLFFFNINETYKLNLLKENNIFTDYGILDIKFNKENSKLFCANSNYTYSIYDFNTNKIDNYLLKEKKEDLPIDIIELYNNNEKCLFGSNDGYFIYYDLIKNKEIFNKKIHDYGIWSLFILNDNLFLSGAEDNLLKLHDIRTKNTISICKEYNSSINYISKLNFNDNILFTGGYEEKILLFDIRNFPKSCKEIKTNHSIWDCKLTNYKNKNLIFMSSSYEGFNIYEIDNDLNMKHIFRMPVTEKEDIFHKTIVYGLDIINKNNKIDVLSCSFYDNLIMHWNFI